MTEPNIKKTKSAAETAVDTAAAPFETFFSALKGVQDKFEMPGAARDFVKKAAETGKERAAKAHADANKVTETVESVLAQSIGDAAAVSRHMIQVAHEDANAALAAIEKLAAAKSLNEAIQLQVDYARERAEVGAARVKNAAEVVMKTFVDRAKMAQDRWAAASPFAPAA